jgi:hypothetical protein
MQGVIVGRLNIGWRGFKVMMPAHFHIDRFGEETGS